MDASDRESPIPTVPPWPNCREPYRTWMANVSAAWLAGEMSHERLALEILQQTAAARHISQPSPGLRRLAMEDVLSQLTILTDALLAAMEAEQKTLPALRQEAFDFNRLRKRSQAVPGLAQQ